jgi:hypothetical protein
VRPSTLRPEDPVRSDRQSVKPGGLVYPGRMGDREYWDTCENCAWSWGPGPEEDANAAALEHQEQTGHQAHASAGDLDTHPTDDTQ